jgi:hypothetical protein
VALFALHRLKLTVCVTGANPRFQVSAAENGSCPMSLKDARASWMADDEEQDRPTAGVAAAVS